MRISLLRLAFSAPIMVIGGPIEIDWLICLLAGILTLEAAIAQLACSVDLIIIRSIVPAACTPTPSTNVLGFGTIPVADLNAANTTTLPGAGGNQRS